MSLSNFVYFLIGFSLAILLIILASKFREGKIYKLFSCKNGIENALIVSFVFLGVLSLIFDYCVSSIELPITPSILGLIGTFGFSYLLTKKFSTKTYRNDLKQRASTAYRHNRNLSMKIEYEIGLIDYVLSEYDRGGAEGYRRTLYRIRDSLIGFKLDTEGNINDWTDIIAEEIKTMNDITQMENEIIDIRIQRQEEDSNNQQEKDSDNQRALKLREKELEKKLKEYKDTLGPVFQIILKNEDGLLRDLDIWLDMEIEKVDLEKVKLSQDFSSMQVQQEKYKERNSKGREDSDKGSSRNSNKGKNGGKKVKIM